MNIHCKRGLIGGAIVAIAYPSILIFLTLILSGAFRDPDISDKIESIALFPLVPIMPFWPFPSLSGGPILGDVLIIIALTLAYLYLIGFIAGVVISYLAKRHLNNSYKKV